MPKNEFICDCNVIHKDLVDNTLKNMPDEQLLKNLSEFFKIPTILSSIFSPSIIIITKYYRNTKKNIINKKRPNGLRKKLLNKL